MDHIAKIATISLESGENRKATDKLFIVIFVINVVVWLLTGIYNVFVMYQKDNNDVFFSGAFEQILIQTGAYGIIAITVSLLVLLFQSLSKFRCTVFLAIFTIVIKILALLILIPWLIYTIFNTYYFYLPISVTIVTLIIAAICLIYQVIIFICVKEVDKAVLSELINESSRAALHSCFPIIFSIMTSFLIIVITLFSVIVSYSMIRERYTVFGSFNMCVFAFESLFIINFICNFAIMVTGDCLAHYYETVDKQQFSKLYIFRSIMTIVRYHLGTVAVLSTPILPRIYAFIMSFRSSDNEYYNENPENKLIKFASKISLTMNITDFALIHTSISGSNALKSTRDMFDLHKYTSTLFLGLNAISVKFIGIITGIAIIVTLTGRILFVDTSNAHRDWPMNSAVMILMLLCTMYVHQMLIRPAMSAFSIYKMIGVRIYDTSKQMILT